MSSASRDEQDGQQAPVILKLLAHDLRWRLAVALAQSDSRVHELAQLTGEPPNLVSYHLRQLRDLGVVTERRSAADGRDVYYALDLPRLHAMYVDAGARLHPALRKPELLDTPLSSTSFPDALSLSGDREVSLQPLESFLLSGDATDSPPIRVLFLCTHNSTRSQLAEGILRHLARGQVEVMSAGSAPTAVDPTAIQVMAEMGIDISDQHAKQVDQLNDQTFSYVITLCDHVREICPMFPGWPSPIHWSFPDPTLVEEADARHHAFVRTALQLFTRIRYLIPVIEQEHARAA